METEALSQDHIERIQKFVAEVLEGLEAAEERFETRRRIIEELDVQAILAVEEGQKVVYARCMLGERVLPVANTTTSGGVRNVQDAFALTARLVL